MNKRYSVLIVEDEPIAADYLQKLIAEHCPDMQVIRQTDSVTETVAWLRANHPDLIFMDIHLADDLSFRIFEECDVPAPVIFTTAFDHYAVKAFRVNSMDYLLKPIDKKEFLEATEKFRKASLSNGTVESIMQAIRPPGQEYRERFLVQQGTELRSIAISDTAYFYAEDKVVFLVATNGKKYILDNSLDKLESALDPEQFFRINRKILLSVNSIDSMQSHSKSRVKIRLQPDLGLEAVVSVERSSDFKKWLDR